MYGLTGFYQFISIFQIEFTKNMRGCPCGVMVKAMDCGIVVSEFVL